MDRRVGGFGLGGALEGARIMATLTTAEIEEFLSHPRVAQLVTLRASGMPHVAPVWFLWENGRALVMADGDAVKVRNIRRNPAVALCVSTAGRPYSYVTIEGMADVTAEGLADMAHKTCALYDGPERGAEFARELLAGGGMALIAIAVDRIISWKDDAPD